MLATTCSVPIPVRRTASTVQRWTAMWSGWPVCPSAREGQHSVGPDRLEQIRRDRLGPGVERHRRAAAVGEAEPAVLVDPEDARQAAISASRISASRSGGQRTGSVTPSSPRVAVTQTTREPASTAAAISPPHRYASSSGWAQTDMIVPRSARSRIVTASQSVSPGGPVSRVAARDGNLRCYGNRVLPIDG